MRADESWQIKTKQFYIAPILTEGNWIKPNSQKL